MTTEPLALSLVNIENFCRQVYSRQYDEAVANLVAILDTVERGSISISTNASKEEMQRYLTQLASAVTAMLSNPGFSISPQGFSALMCLKCHLRTIFGSTGFGNMGHIASSISTRDGENVTVASGHMKLNFLLASTLDAAPDGIFEFVHSLEDESRFLFWLTCLDSRFRVNSKEDNLLQKMLALGETIRHCSANSIAELQVITRVWMLCSYWSYSDKHQAKQILNSVLKNTLKKLGVVEPEKLPEKKGRDKPTIVVVLESWKWNSAMYRCYGKVISSLSGVFNVVGFAQSGTFDTKAAQIFDRMESFDITAPIKSTVGKLIRLQGDIIYYPSVGMQQTAIQLCQLRLAPIQIMSPGHPASSFSEAIDYVIFEEDMLSDPDCFSETILLLRSGTIPLTRPDNKMIQSNRAKKKGKINISVNSMYFKLSSQFLEICKRIQDGALVDIHFHFLIGLSAYNRIQISRVIENHVSATCYEFLSYEKYSEIISHCDVQLTPFPFGNSNSFVDAMLVGVPTVCMDGPEIHSHIDVALAQRVRLPEFCQTTSPDAYVDAVLRLVHDDELRESTQKLIMNADLDEALFNVREQADKDMREVFSWIVAHHKAIQGIDQKVWAVEDRLQFPFEQN
jgi:hypothetical protein